MQFRTALINKAKVIVSTHEAAEALGGRPNQLALLVIDEAGQTTELHSTMSLVNLVRSGGRLVLVGDPKELPPAVISKFAADLGLCASIFDRRLHALRGQDSAVIQLAVRYRMHPQILVWPSRAFYDNCMTSGFLAPVSDGPP
eukprot:1996928-Pyramimonas_sp.AAC.1